MDGIKLEQGTELFMTNWIVAQRARYALRYAVVSVDMTGKTQESVVQSKHACDGLSVTVD